MDFYIAASLVVLVALALLALCIVLSFKTNVPVAVFWYLQNRPFIPKCALYAWCLTQYYHVAAALFWYIYDVLKDCYMRNGLVYLLIVPYLHWMFFREVMSFLNQEPKGERGVTTREDTGECNVPDPGQTESLNSTTITAAYNPNPAEVQVRTPIEVCTERTDLEPHGVIASNPVQHNTVSFCLQEEEMYQFDRRNLSASLKTAFKALQPSFYSNSSDITSASVSEPKTLAKTGLVIIINIVNFCPELNIEPRVGSELDEEDIEETFTQPGMNYEVVKIRDKTSADLTAELSECAKKANDNRHYQAFAIFVLSHGDKGQILAADGQTISMYTIANYFSTKEHPNLDGKPRVVIFQACLGTKKPEFTNGALRVDLSKTCDEGKDKEIAKYLQYPKEAKSDHLTDPNPFVDPVTDEHSIPSADGPDFVFGFATLPGCTAIRTPEGSPFIKFLMNEIRSNLKDPFRISVIDMLHFVNRRMVQDHGICIQLSSTARGSVSFRRQP